MNLSDLKNYTVLPSGVSTNSSIQDNKQKKTVGQKVESVAQGITNFVGAKGIADEYGATIARAKAPQNQKNLVQFPSTKEVVGSAVQTGALLIPGAGVGANLATKVGVGAATGYALDVGSKLQDKNNTVGESFVPGVGTAVGTALPVAGAIIKPAVAIVGRLFKGLGAGLSGVPSETIDKIVSNPKLAQQATEKLAKTGNSGILEENAKTILNGVSKIRQEARSSYGKAIQELKSTDINPQTFRQSLQPVLDNFGSVTQGNVRELSNVEFSNPTLIKKASSLIDDISNTNLDGFSLNKLINKIDNSAFKTTGTDAERLSFNAFVRQLSDGLSSAITSSTDKLGEINQKFSQDMQLTEAVQNIFGKVKFKNLPEVVKASQKLETLFSQKGLAPDVVDNFLNRIGVTPEQFKTSEAIRQISNKASGANTKGLSIGETIQQATSAVITPKMVRDLSIKTGLAREKLIPFLQGMKSSARKILINALLNQGNE